MELPDKEERPVGNTDIINFVLKLNDAVMDREIPTQSPYAESPEKNETNIVARIVNVLDRIKKLTENHLPENYTGCRFGNKAHTMWLKEVLDMWDDVAKDLGIDQMDEVSTTAIKENFMNSFGSQVRIDYGTGHEIQFALFLKGMHKLGLITEQDFADLVLEVFSRYFKMIHYLIDRYNLEPAGSKGAWGLDHYQFLPFLLGSAQLASNVDLAPSSILKHGEASPETDRYIFLQAVEYIKEKVNGIPLEISSPMLHGICTSCTWRQINTGLIKMYKDDIVNIARIKHRC